MQKGQIATIFGTPAAKIVMVEPLCQSEKESGLLHESMMALSILGNELTQTVGNQVLGSRQDELAAGP